MIKLRSLALLIAGACSLLVVVSQAEAEILSLDCAAGNLGNFHLWIDMQKSTVTWQYTGQDYANTWPAQITATIINWVNGDIQFHLSRTTGTLGMTQPNLPSGTSQCTKGMTPFPATKF